MATQSIENIFGSKFQQYCLCHKILLQQDKCGAFKMSVNNSNKTFTDCLNVFNDIKLEMNKELENLQKEKSIDHLAEIKAKTETKKWKIFPKENVYHHLWHMNNELNIYLYNTSSTLPSYKSYTDLTSCLLNTDKTGNEIYNFIIKETIKNNIITNYEISIPTISVLLEQFKKKHKKFHYFSVLKHLTCKQEFNQRKSKCEYQINKKQLKLFFDLIFAKVVPLNIFGKLKNLKKIKRIMFYLLDIPCYESLNLRPFIEKLDLFNIKWLQDIKSISMQWCIIAKFVKWFFVGYLLKILHTYFHMTASKSNNERLYIMRSTWNLVQKKFIKKRIRSKILQPDIKYNEWKPPIGIYTLFPKQSDVRPIFKPENIKSICLNVVFKFLKQLHITKYGVTNFEQKWKSIVQYKCNEATNLYFVCCDVANAFGSIIQEELYNIIQSLCKDLPENLMFKYYAVKSKQAKEVCYKQYFSDPSLLLPLAPNVLYSDTCKNWQQIRKTWLLEQISKFIFCQRVKINKKVYVITKGVVQGSPISPILSDIYYNFILHKEMSAYLNAGEIIKYMDDILYVTKNETFAKQFLQSTRKGIPQYNCYFKVSKTQSNIICNETIAVNNIIYIGYKINCTTLEVEYKRSQKHLCSMKFLKKNDLPPLIILRKQLNNVACLRLSKFILNRTINSKMTIIRKIRKICLLQAKRACTLIKELFDSNLRNVRGILLVIQETNERIARHIIKIFLIGKRGIINKLSFHRWNHKILHILWMSYVTVFMKDKILQPKFIRYFSKCK
ncbi:hypothetical protein E2986_07580 [Frieseomelitta varia]|uniref:Telomerase reverse transcriptase n=1 Tax=Frieseomelitta varia TaxID=561572 RepID=A0A833VP69_9HYME|nr:hypothetical protein E2986_07580 [Frieseomelitta varia]